MTKPFGIKYTCANPDCRWQTTAETGFGRWMRGCSGLDSTVKGIIRTDMDHIICRCKTTIQQRDFQLVMVVEVKEHGAEPDAAQRDVLLIIDSLCRRRGKNRYDAKTEDSVKLFSHFSKKWVLVRWFGVHLLQFEMTNPNDSTWIKWDRKIVTEPMLVQLLAMERNPYSPGKLMDDYLRDRHRKKVVTPYML